MWKELSKQPLILWIAKEWFLRLRLSAITKQILAIMSRRRVQIRQMTKVNEWLNRATDLNRCAQMDNHRSSVLSARPSETLRGARPRLCNPVLFRRNQVSPGRSRTLSLHPAPAQSEVLADGELS